jgi:hypothetical protein
MNGDNSAVSMEIFFVWYWTVMMFIHKVIAPVE